MNHAGHQSLQSSLPAAGPTPSASVPAHGPAAAGPRHTVELTGTQALGLLGGTSLGRIVFTQRALPAIRPVNHLLDRGQIVIRTHQDSDLFVQARHHGDRGVVVAYQADDIDPLTHLGWSCDGLLSPRDRSGCSDALPTADQTLVGPGAGLCGPHPSASGHRDPADGLMRHLRTGAADHEPARRLPRRHRVLPSQYRPAHGLRRQRRADEFDTGPAILDDELGRVTRTDDTVNRIRSRIRSPGSSLPLRYRRTHLRPRAVRSRLR